MSSLINQKIKDTYEGLIKTSDDQPIDGTLKNLQDGNGGVLPIQVSTSTVNFTGAVTGLDAGGLVAGTGTNSMESSTSLTSSPADAVADNSLALMSGATTATDGDIVIGNNATSVNQNATFKNDIIIGTDAKNLSIYGGESIIIGKGATMNINERNIILGTDAQSNRGGQIVIGHEANGGANYNVVAIGNQSSASGSDSIAIGKDATTATTSNDSVAIGTNAQATGTGNDGRVAIGKDALASNNKAIAIGANGTSCAAEGIALGDGVAINSGNDRAIAIGNAITVSTNADDSIVMGTAAGASNQSAIALGRDASATADKSVAIGRDVVAAIADTVSIKALEVQTDSTPTAGGIIMSDAGGTDRRINITAAGDLQIDSSGIGGFKVKTTTQVTSTTTGADETLISLLIPANTLSAGDLIDIYAHVAFDFTGGGSIYFNSGLGPAVNTNIMQVGTGGFSTGAGVSTKRTIAVHVADGTGLGSSTPAIDTNARGNNYPNNTYTFPDNDSQALDWTSDMYLNVYVYVDNAGSSATLMSAYAKVI